MNKKFNEGLINNDISLFSKLGQGIIALDSNYNIVSIDKKAIEILHITDNTKLNGSFSGFLAQAKLPEKQISNFVKKIPEIKIDHNKEVELLNKDIVLITGALISNPDLTEEFIILSFLNISSLREIEKKKRQFVANVSHELKTPLTSIQGYIETMIDSDLSNNLRDKFLKIVQKQSNRLRLIIEDLLMLSKLEKDELDQSIELTYQSVNSIIDDAVTQCEMKKYKKNILLIKEFDTNLFSLINPSLLEQAVVNLIQNAIKYSPENSKVEVILMQSKHSIKIKVKDQGPGIPPEYFERIFERFFSVDKARSRELGGSGLGLSIVKHIVLNHNGNVYVENNPGQGSVFTISLPKVKRPKIK
jgi:two-component system, OmpR family, phosphate regulon sensor histidine kinase PhoR